MSEKNINNSDHSSQDSVLKMPQILFDEIRFVRHGFQGASETSIDIASRVLRLEEGRYRVSLRATAKKPNEYDALVQISGFCEIDETLPEKDVLLEQNAVAILFPYLRSELTLLTAQPGVQPIVLPVTNVAAAQKAKTNK